MQEKQETQIWSLGLKDPLQKNKNEKIKDHLQ